MRTLAHIACVIGLLALPFDTPVTAAAAPGAPAEPDPVAALTSRVRAEPVLRGTFTQNRQIRGFKRPVTSTGDFVVARDRGILWHTKTPFDSTLAMTPDRLRVVDARQQAEVDLDARREPMLRTLNGLLQAVVGGDVAALTRAFDLDARLVGSDAWELTLVPREAALRARFSRVRMSGAAYVREVALEEANGDLTTVTLAGHEADVRLTDDETKRLQ